jgi:hypothetical protein
MLQDVVKTSWKMTSVVVVGCEVSTCTLLVALESEVKTGGGVRLTTGGLLRIPLIKTIV